MRTIPLERNPIQRTAYMPIHLVKWTRFSVKHTSTTVYLKGWGQEERYRYKRRHEDDDDERKVIIFLRVLVGVPNLYPAFSSPTVSFRPSPSINNSFVRPDCLIRVYVTDFIGFERFQRPRRWRWPLSDADGLIWSYMIKQKASLSVRASGQRATDSG